MIYLASPYTHDDPKVRAERWIAVCKECARLMSRGIKVFSPIAHTHPIALQGLRGDWDFWKSYDSQFLEWCSELWVLMLEGWEDSVGIKEEIELAKCMGKPIQYVIPMNDELCIVKNLEEEEADKNLPGKD